MALRTLGVLMLLALASAAAAGPRRFDDLAGLTEKQVVARWGEPDERKGQRWTYRFPRSGCTDRETVYTLRFAKHRVARVARTYRQTGKYCAPEP
jgi:hypothetical protein